MRVLVTGSSGRIGRALIRELRQAGAATVGIDQAPTARDDALATPDRFVRASLASRRWLADAMTGCDAVVHLAAIPSPAYPDPVDLFAQNTVATFAVLDAARLHGIRPVVLASSISALGLAWSPGPASPDYVPIDEAHPLRPLDPYGVGKECDEAIARMAAGRWGLSIVSLRYPYTASAAQIEERAAAVVVDPEEGAKELWAYLDVRDAAVATRLAIEYAANQDGGGWCSITVTSKDSLSDLPLPDLLARYHPTTEIRADMAVVPAYDSSAAETRLGFQPVHLRSTRRSR